MSTGLIITLIILGLVFLFGLLPTAIMSYYIYRVLFVRTSPDKWEKEVSRLSDEESRKMDEIGDNWERENRQFKKAVTAYSGKIKLCGEYFDFGFDKAVIIIPGRMESHSYSYFFATPYKEAGHNVLVIDNRAHGFSGGKRSSLGIKEQYDLIAWGKYLHDEHSVKHVVLHGICIGSSSALNALTNRACPEYIDAMISEGMYTSFYHSFVNHIRLQGHPVFPFALETCLWAGLFSGGRLITDGPKNMIKKLTKPALFIHSKEDQYSLPEASGRMYEKCTSSHRVRWFGKGTHSRIKINNLSEYDGEIISFLSDIDKSR